MSDNFLKYFSPEQYNNVIRFSTEWKWLILLASPFIFYALKLIILIVIKAFRRKIHHRFQSYKMNSFTKHFSKMKFEQIGRAHV